MKNIAPLRSIVLFAMVLLCGMAANAQQTVIHPKAGDPIRKTLFNAMRPAFEKDLNQKVIFKVDEIRVYQNWAYVGGEPLRPDQGPLDYKRTKYAGAVQAEIFGYDYSALLHKINGSWKLVTFDIGATDVVYADWWKRFRAPKAVMPFSE